MPLAALIILAIWFIVLLCLCVSLILVSIRYREDGVDTPAREARSNAQAVHPGRRPEEVEPELASWAR
jgi:hypothetical protein